MSTAEDERRIELEYVALGKDERCGAPPPAAAASSPVQARACVSARPPAPP